MLRLKLLNGISWITNTHKLLLVYAWHSFAIEACISWSFALREASS